ncbi:MAG TPA: hypothetical protein VF610_11005 [Segetibacter sp.]|jgi:hypothetical protein
MKKLIAFIVFFLVSGVVALYGKKINYLMFEKGTTKTVKFSVYAGSDYSASLYKRSKAKVLLTIYKFANGERTVVWEGIVDEGPVKNYPVASTPLVREVSIYNVFESQETLVASYKVMYDSKEAKLSYENGIVMSDNLKGDTLAIAI